MSVESARINQRLLPWEPKFELFGVALSDSKPDGTVEIRFATETEKYYHKNIYRTPVR